MPPELNRDQPVYRPSRGGVDPTTRRLAIMAGGIGAILAALVGGWSLAGHHAGGVPVIEPPSGPERVKPVNPGGLQLLGAEPPSASAGTGAETLAPGPETPDPQALQAELGRARKDQAATEPPGPSAPVAKPQAQATVTKPTPALVPPTPTAPPAGRVEVQLAAMDTEAQAQAEWARLSHRDPLLFADRTPVIVTATRGGKTLYRLRTGGFQTIADATGFCERSRAAGAACTIAAF